MIIDGKAIAEQIQNDIKGMNEKTSGRKPCLAVLLVGENPASHIYVKRKGQACENVGMISLQRQFPDTITEEALLHEVKLLNEDPTVDGILVQLPLPHHINSMKIMFAIDPAKDVDGFHPLNVGKLLIGETDGFFPCTPYGVKVMLDKSGVEVTGKHALVIGRSNIVGKPMAALLMQNTPGGNATVTIAHSHTKNIKELCLLADIIIVAIGKAHYVTADMVKEGTVLVDVGMNKIPNPSRKEGYQLVGDADFENLKDKCSLITPVPGGVGPMTIAMLISNTWKSFLKRTSHLLLGLLFLIISSCQPNSELPPSTTSFTGNAMTIDYRITIGSGLPPQKKIEIEQIIATAFSEVDSIYNKWNPDSELAKINHAPARVAIPLSPQLESFLKQTDQIVTLTEGRFDPTIEPMQQLWKNKLEKGGLPTQSEIAALAPAIGWKNIHFGNGTISKDYETTMLDLGGIAKGYAVDILTERLNEGGFSNVYVEWGGEIRATGHHPERRPWNIFISRLEDPDAAQAIALVNLRNQAIATSGDYYQYWTVGDRRYFHIIDPHLHTPLIASKDSIASASVLADTCAFADGLATAAMTFSSVDAAQAWATSIQDRYPSVTFWIVSR